MIDDREIKRLMDAGAPIYHIVDWEKDLPIALTLSEAHSNPERDIAIQREIMKNWSDEKKISFFQSLFDALEIVRKMNEDSK